MLQNLCQSENHSSLSTFFNGGKFQNERRDYLFKKGKHISPSARHVYHMLLLRAGTQSYVWSSLLTIEDETGYTRPTVLKCLKELQDANFLRKYKTMKKNGWGNVYELDPAKICNQNFDFDIGQIEDNDNNVLCDENTTDKVILPIQVKPLYPNNNLILKEKKIGKEKYFINYQNQFINDEIPENYLEEAKKCYQIPTDNTKFDGHLETSFKLFLKNRRRKEYQHTQNLLDDWKMWIYRDTALEQKAERAKRAEERKTDPKPIQKSTKITVASQNHPKTELEAVTEWQETFSDQVIACEKIEELQPAMKEAVETGGIVCGSAGCGKTTTATELVKAFKEQKTKAEIYNWVSLYKEHLENIRKDNLGQTTFMKSGEIINFIIRHYQVLVLDEVGMKPMTPAEKALFYRIVDERLKLGLPTTVITNYDPQHLKSPDGIGFQSFDRLVQGKKIVTCSWGSLRNKLLN